MRRSRLAAARAGHVRKRGQPCGRQRNVGAPRGPHLMVSTSMVYGCTIDVFNTENISAECLRDKVLPALPGLLRCCPLGNHAKLNWCPRTCKEARCALRAASLFASCGVRWKVNPYRALGILGCVRTSNPTYISEFGCGGRLAVGCFEMQAVLWEGATPWDGMGRLVEEGFYG